MRTTLWLVGAAFSVLVACGLWLFGRRSVSPLTVASREFRAVEAGREAALTSALEGAEQARAKILSEHDSTVALLTARQKEKANALAGDPAGLARYLVRVALGGQKR